MNKNGLLKSILGIIISVLLIASLTSVVFAADDLSDAWEDTGTSVPDTTTSQTTGSTDTTTTGIETSGTSTSGTSSTTGIETTGTSTTTSSDTTSSISTGSATTTLSTNEDEDKSEDEVNSLAYTGIEDNYVLPGVIIIGAIVAGYSLKKLRDYNNI